jgi:ribosome-binding factor A
MKSRRNQRLDSEFKKAIYDIVTNKLMLTDGLAMFTITEVDISPDIKNAKVYVSIYAQNEEKKKQAFDKIKNASNEIRRHLSQVMSTRTVPSLRFIEDSSSSYGEKIDRILSTITYGEDNEDN